MKHGRLAIIILTLCAVLAGSMSVCVGYKRAKAEDIFLTEEERAYVEGGRTLKVGYVSDRKPISFKDEDGGLGGASRKVFDRIAQISGLRFEYVEIPAGDIKYDYLREAGFDLITSVEYNDENKKARGILMSNPYMTNRKVIVAREGFRFDPDSSHRVAISTGSQTIKKVISDRYPNFQLQDYPSVEACLKAINAGQADIMIQNQYVAEYWLYKPVYKDMLVIPIIEMKDQLCFSAVTPLEGTGAKQEEGELLISIIDKSIARLSDAEVSGYVIAAALENKYEYSVSDFAYQYRYMLIIAGIAVVLIIALVCVSLRFRLKSIHSNAEAKAKGDFLSMMSHEIRTPLNGLISLNYLMSQNIGDADKMSEYLKQSSEVSKYLLSLLNNILDMSKIQGKQMDIEHEPLDLRLLLKTVETMEEGGMESKRISFHMEEDLPYPLILGDAVRIQQVVLNLLDNARKYTKEGGYVKVKAVQKQDGQGGVLTKIHVMDNGIGMSEEFQKKIFMPFTQERTEVSQGNQGTGLGLSISAMIAEIMGGKLSVESKPGKGSHFIFAFPAKQATADGGGSAGGNDAEARSGVKNEQTSILVAEDNELNGQLLAEVLEEEGFKVRHVLDGKQAVEAFSGSAIGEYKVILMDLLMPVMNGFEAARRIRELDRSDAHTVKIFASTANTAPDDEKKAYESGMDDFIAKPINIKELLEKLS